MRVVTVVACIAFPVLSHLGAVTAEPRWTVLGIVLVAWLVAASRLRTFGALLAALAAAALGAGLSEVRPALVIAAPPVLLNLGLCALFAATLLPGREPMISRFARLERGGELPPDLRSYTRILTVAWAGFFLAMAAISVALATWSSVAAWTLFTNVLNYLLVALFFLLEYGYRRVRFVHYRHADPRELLRQVHRYRVFSPPTDGS